VDAADYDYDLPEERIAQVPVEPRDAARLLVDLGDRIDHRHVRDLVGVIEPGDLVIVNRTRVLHARLHLVKATGGAAEVLLVEPRPELGDGCWEALVRPGRRLNPGTVLASPARSGPTTDGLRVVVGQDLGDGVRLVTVTAAGDLALDLGIEANGEVPLPPYIHTPLADPERYQTVYASATGAESVAAPTAGLHLTPDLLSQIRDHGAQVEHVDLVVGLGTFRPITVDQVEDHVMHAERYRVPEATMDAVRDTRRGHGRVVAIGTTTVRALEAVAASGQLEGRTDLFITPGFEFQVVDRLMTNFHTPRSSLLVMIDAFVGADPDGTRRWRDIYRQALAGEYRFLSFGDAMFLTRHDHGDRGE
jgi:S-adenosylmethionine:tRNA ribosyltransferase-isomerase